MGNHTTLHRSDRPVSNLFYLGLFLGLAAAIGGCAKKAPPEVERADFENLAKIQSAYREAAQKLGRAPKDMKEFDPFLEKQGDPNLLLISSFDKQPYAILWNVNMQGYSREAKTPAIIAYDRQGVGGDRHVLTIMGITRMSEDRFEAARQAWKIANPEPRSSAANPVKR